METGADFSLVRLPILDARADWITATASRGERGLELLTWAAVRCEEERDLGNKQEKWRWMGYDGFQAGSIRYGWGEHGAIMVVSGERAYIHAAPLAVRADHWSRVDYCVTVLDASGAYDFTTAYYESLAAATSDKRSALAVSHLRSLDGGSTLNLGSRQSAAYCRVYNKHVESGGAYPAGSWRFEVELKRHASEFQQAAWKQAPRTAHNVIGIVAGYLGRAGLSLPFDVAQTVRPAPYARREPDAERAIEWMMTQVAPCVEWVKEARGTDVVREALGL